MSFGCDSFGFIFQMVVDSVKAGVISVVYEHSGMTLESLLYLTEKALGGRTAQSVGILSDGDSREINLLQGKRGWERTTPFPLVWCLSQSVCDFQSTTEIPIC